MLFRGPGPHIIRVDVERNPNHVKLVARDAEPRMAIYIFILFPFKCPSLPVSMYGVDSLQDKRNWVRKPNSYIGNPSPHAVRMSPLNMGVKATEVSNYRPGRSHQSTCIEPPSSTPSTTYRSRQPVSS
jgi:hypothetical protein